MSFHMFPTERYTYFQSKASTLVHKFLTYWHCLGILAITFATKLRFECSFCYRKEEKIFYNFCAMENLKFGLYICQIGAWSEIRVLMTRIRVLVLGFCCSTFSGNKKHSLFLSSSLSIFPVLATLFGWVFMCLQRNATPILNLKLQQLCTNFLPMTLSWYFGHNICYKTPIWVFFLL